MVETEGGAWLALAGLRKPEAAEGSFKKELKVRGNWAPDGNKS